MREGKDFDEWFCLERYLGKKRHNLGAEKIQEVFQMRKKDL